MAQQLKPSGIGGQAVMEGVMMRNRSKYAVAVRKPDGEIVINVKEYHSVGEKHKFLALPFVRGAVNLVESMIVGMGTLMYSANFAEDETPDKKAKAAGEAVGEAEEAIDTAAETLNAAADTPDAAVDTPDAAADAKESADVKNAADTKKQDGMSAGMIGATVALSLVLTIALFMLLPFAVTSGLEALTGISSPWFSSIVEGVLRMGIFIGYVAAISLMPEIKRVYRYHGAEHKSINCIEHGLDLTVDNVRASSKEHKRCGTSFMIFVMVISILVFSIVNMFPIYTGDSQIIRFLVRFGVRILLLPLVAGLSYEFLRLAGRTDNKVINILSKPGLWMQALTTKEPDDEMIKVAMVSVNAVFDWREFHAGTKPEDCPAGPGVGEYLLKEDGTYEKIVTGFLKDETER